MSNSICLRCLRRSLRQIENTSTSTRPDAVQRAAFSTSSTLAANPPKKKAVVAKPSGRTLRLTKNKRAANARPPAPGERKELRKRVVLSNTNALEVAGLQELTATPTRGSVLAFKNETVDTLRALEAFKPTQGWGLFRRPASLIREDTIRLADNLEWIAEGGREGRSVRKILCGERGSGKSVLQLQALALASLKRWVVVHIPEAKDLTNAHASYQPISTAEGILYAQPHYTAKLLGNVLKANAAILSKLRLSKQHNIPVPLQPDTTLARLAELGSRDPDLASPVWEALLSELLSPSQAGNEGLTRPPVLFTLDGLDHIMRLSSYLNAESDPIHAHELSLIRPFVKLLAGKTAMPNGGMVLGAVSESNRAATPTLDHFVGVNLVRAKNEERETSQRLQRWDPYVAQDKWVQEAVDSVDVLKLQGLSKDEARGVLEYYARSGMMRNTVTDGLVSEKWTLAGGGIIGQIEQASVRARF